MLKPVFDGPRDEKYKYWVSVWGKHLDTLLGWLAGDEMRKEAMLGRLDDLRVYLDILEAMMEEDAAADLLRQGIRAQMASFGVAEER